jgi:hypothetical protein
MAPPVTLQLRAAPNVAENDYSLEQVFSPIAVANPLGNVYLTTLGVAGFSNFFGPPSGTYTYVIIIPDPNYTSTYTLKGPSTDTGVQCKGVTVFPCIGAGGASPSFGIFLPTPFTGLNWTFMFI